MNNEQTKISEISLFTKTSSRIESLDLIELREKLKKCLPESMEKCYERDLIRLESLPIYSVDYQKILTQLEFLTELPWQNLIESHFDHLLAKKILDESHFGLRDIKEQILEYMAISSVKLQTRAPKLIFVGPAGMGKVSLAFSVAKSLGRPVERINFATARNQRFMIGESRSQPHVTAGSLIRAIHRSGVRNPIIILEEIDHIDWGRSDNPGISLLEILDHRNTNFIDEYVGVPFDISQIWFIATANSLDNIPRSLRAHMEIIEFSGYTDMEKIQIATRSILPRCLEEANLEESSLHFEKSSLLKIVHRYTRESGVVQLQRCLRKITRKVARKNIESNNSSSVTIDNSSIAAYLGPEWFFEEESRNPKQTGVATGLVWTESGGEVIYIEAVRLPQGRGLILTGRLGKVMRESAETALSYLWSRAKELSISESNFVHVGTHIHVPAGSIAKDGPSAGLTIFVALASLFLQRPIPQDIAMTGEITLTGDIFPVGGIRAKALAAHRAGFKRLLIPKQNETDLQVLPEEILRDLQFILIKNVEEVLPIVFPGLTKAQKSNKKSRLPKNKQATHSRDFNHTC